MNHPIYVRADTREALRELELRAAESGVPLNRLICLAIRELARHDDPLLVVTYRLATPTRALPSA